MRERPILFSAPMVRAILDDRKTQTRRAVKSQPPAGWDRHCWFNAPLYGWTDQPSPASDWHTVRCPYGVPGDRLWVRESCWIYGRWVQDGLTEKGNIRWSFQTIGREVRYDDPPKAARTKQGGEHPGFVRRPSIHMPRWASRILLEVAEIRVERLQAITWDDAIAEGVVDTGRRNGEPWPHCYVPGVTRGYEACAVATFLNLWEHINGDGSVKADPWCWVVVFRRVAQEARAA